MKLAETKYKRSPVWTIRVLEDKYLLINICTNHIFSTNQVGKFIYDNLESKGINQIIQELYVKTNHRLEDIKNDVTSFTKLLVEKDIFKPISNFNKNDSSIYNEILKTARQKRLPFQATIEVTRKCNFKCNHCYIPKTTKSELNTDEWKRILENLRESNIFSILFTGGEPFIREDFMEIYLYAKKLGFRISIYTNGYSLSEESLFYLEKYKPHKIYITLYGVNSHSYQSMVHVTDAYEKVLNNIFRFQKAGISLVLRTQLTPFTDKYLEKMKGFANEIGVPFNFGSVIVPDLDLEGGESNICNLDPKKIVEYEELDLNRKNERARQDDIFEFTMKTNPFEKKIPWSCGAVSSSLTITNQGYMVPCVQLPFPKYDLADTSVDLAWNKLYGDIQSLLEEEEVQDQIKKCSGCEYFTSCSICPAWFLRVKEKKVKDFIDNVLCPLAKARGEKYPSLSYNNLIDKYEIKL